MRELKHPVFDGVVKLKFVKDHPASQSLKDCVDRTLRVPAERAEDWKPGSKEGQQVNRYYVARHHYTEKHIQKSLADPKGFSFLKPFSMHGAKKYLYTVDPKETFQVTTTTSSSSQEDLYLQCPNVPKEAVKAELSRFKEGGGHAEDAKKPATTTTTTTTTAATSTKTGAATKNGRNPHPGVGEKKDSLTVSTTRSQQQLEKEVKQKEVENKKLKDELDMMKSQLGFLHDMVRKLQEEHFADSHTVADHHSVRSGRSYRSRSVSNRQTRNNPHNRNSNNNNNQGGSNRSARSGVPREINFGEDGDDDDGEWEQANTEDWTEYQDDQTPNQTEDYDDDADEGTSATFQVTYTAARRLSGGTQASRGAMSIVSASKSVKTLPRELELDEDEDDSDSHESLEDDQTFVSSAFSRGGLSRSAHSRSVHSRSGHSRSGHSHGREYGGGEENYGTTSNAMAVQPRRSLMNKKPSRRSSIGDSSHRSARSTTTSQSAAGTYDVAAMDVTDPYGEKGTYTGSISNSTGMPHGFGRLEYDRAGRWYEGDWKHGRWTGQGRLSNGDGDFYEGGLKNDHKHGQGIMKFADGRTFEGEYINGQMIDGKMTYQDGSTYAGSWVDGMRHGRGKCVFTDDSIYDGEFREGEFSGHGRMAWSDGGWYEGEWWNGEMHGYGKEIRPDGSSRHDGEWAKGQPVRK